MRSLSTILFALLLLISIVGVPPTAHALTDEEVIASQSTFGDDYNSDYAAMQAANPEAVATAQSNAERAPSLGKSSSDDAYNDIMIRIMALFAWLAGVAMIVLNYAVYYTVVVMGAFVRNLSAIGATWEILRDVGNIMLIFGFLAVGVTTILNVGWYGGGKKMLPMMFIAAVFLNFSLFFTEAIIDVSNLFAVQFYTQINGGTPISSVNSLNNQGISGTIMARLGLTEIYGSLQNSEQAKTILSKGSPWFIGFMSIILFIILSFVMLSLAFVLIARFIILIFLIILAPVGFAGLAVPMLARRAGQWWSKLFEQVLTAPILLFMLYIALRIITAPQFFSGTGTITNGVNGPSWVGVFTNNFTGFASLLLSFLVAMGLLLAVVIQSKNLSAFGASVASQTAGKLSFGLVGWAGRRTVGRLATASASKFRSSEYTKGIARTNIGRLFAGGLDAAAKGSYDVRGTGYLGQLPIGDIGAGKAQEGGYAKIKEDAVQSRLKYAKSLSLTAKEEEQVKKLKEEEVILEKDVRDIDSQLSELDKQIKKARENGNQAEEGRLMSAKRVTEKEKEDKDEVLRKKKEEVMRAKNIPQFEYAEGMERWSTVGGPESSVGKALSIPYWLLVGPAANKVASKKLLSEAKKSTEEKELDALRALVAKAGEKPEGNTDAAKPAEPTGGAPAH